MKKSLLFSFIIILFLGCNYTNKKDKNEVLTFKKQKKLSQPESAFKKEVKKPEPKPKVKKQPIIETHISGSGLGEYKTKYYPESGKYHCSCPGYWRSSGNCKHVKQMKNKINNE